MILPKILTRGKTKKEIKALVKYAEKYIKTDEFLKHQAWAKKYEGMSIEEMHEEAEVMFAKRLNKLTEVSL